MLPIVERRLGFLRFVVRLYDRKKLDGLGSTLVTQNDRLNLSFVNDGYIVGKKMTGNGCKTVILDSKLLVINLFVTCFHEFRIYELIS